MEGLEPRCGWAEAPEPVVRLEDALESVVRLGGGSGPSGPVK